MYILNYKCFEERIGIDGDVFDGHLESDIAMLQHYVNNSLNMITLYNMIGKDAFIAKGQSLDKQFTLLKNAISEYCKSDKQSQALSIINIMENSYTKGKKINITRIQKILF